MPRFRPQAGFIVASTLFAAVFVALVLSAFHAPSPHGLPVGIVAPATVSAPVEQALNRAVPGGFDVRAYGGEAVRSAVYFDGYGTTGPLWTLAAWAVAGVTALALVTAWRWRTAGAPVANAASAPPDTDDTHTRLPALTASVRQGAGGMPGTAGSDLPSGPALPEADGGKPAAPAGVVAGFDNSGPARRALGEAVRLAAARHGVLHVVYADHAVIDSDLSGFGYAEMEAARDLKAAEAAKAAADIVARAGIPYTFERRPGAPADAILDAATALAGAPEDGAPGGDGPVIVVGRSGHAARHPLGSVPTHLLHRSPYPVLAIP